MKKKVVVFAGFILIIMGFSTVHFSCEKKKYDLTSIEAILKHIIVRADGDFDYEYIFNPNGITSIAFDSLLIDVEAVYEQSNSLSWEFLRKSKYEKVTDIIITSNKNYNAQYPAGTNLKGIISAWAQYTSSGYGTIDAMLKYTSNLPYDVSYMFNTPPYTEEVHDITIIYKTKKQKFSTVVKNVKILK